jgi:hypothetical protein
MADVEYYLGTCGPYTVDDADPLYIDDGQMLCRRDISNIVGTIATITHDAPEQNPPDASSEFLVIDVAIGGGIPPVTTLTINKITWAHLKAATLNGGITQNVTIGGITLEFTDGLLTNVT